MKYLFLALLFITLLCTCGHAQTVTLFQVDTSYYAAVVTETENGTNRPDVTVDTVLVGGLEDAVFYVASARRRERLRYNRKSADMVTSDYVAADRMFVDLAESLGSNIDSLTTDRCAPRLFLDTFVIVVRDEDIPLADLADYVTDPTPTGRVQIRAALTKNNKGRYRIEAVDAAGRWPLTMNSESDFDLGGWLGGKANFFLAYETSRRKVFIPREAAVGGRTDSRIIVRQ